MKKALCVGINNYPGSANDLQGCLNDVSDWSNLLSQAGFENTIIKDSAATKSKIKSTLASMISASQAGDVLVFQYSGHGTSVIDTSGDEADSYDEALYVYDGALIDDELREIFTSIPAGVQVIVFLDSCFSGTATRVPIRSGVKRKYVQTDVINRSMKKRRSFLVSEDMKEILVAGCGDDEYCYDANFNGRPNGAFSYYAIETIKSNLTYSEFIDALNKKLPSSNYPQTPQLECSSTNAKRLVFSSSTGEVPAPSENEFRFEFQDLSCTGEVTVKNNKWIATIDNFSSTSRVSAISAILAVIKKWSA